MPPRRESAQHAVTRMRRQGYSDAQIAGQFHRWHPDRPPPSTLTVPHADTGFRGVVLTPRTADRRAVANVIKTQLTEPRVPRVVKAAAPVPRSSRRGGALARYQPYDPIATGNIPGLQPHRRYAPTPDLRTPFDKAVGEAFGNLLADPTGGIFAGKSLYNLARHPSLGTGAEAAMGVVGVVPFLRGPRAAARFARELHAGKTIAEAAKTSAVSFGERGPIRAAADVRRIKRARADVQPVLESDPLRHAVHGEIDQAVARSELTPEHAQRLKGQLDENAAIVADRLARQSKGGALRQKRAANGLAYYRTLHSAAYPAEHAVAPVEGAVRAAVAPAEEAARAATRPTRGVVSPENFTSVEHGADILDRYYPIKQRGQPRVKVAGLPKTIKSRADLGRLTEDMAGRLEAGLQFAQHWYRDSGREILQATGGDINRADKLAQLVAIYSPQKPVAPNIAIALRVLDDIEHGRGVRYGNIHQKRLARQVAQDKDWLSRVRPDQLPKVRRFYANLLKHIAPERLAQHGFSGREVTVDGWMGAAFGYGFNTGNAGLTEPQFKAVEDIVQRLADHYKIAPEEAQAAIWTSIKAERDRSTAKQYANPATRLEALQKAGQSFADAIFTPKNTLRLPFEAMSPEKQWLHNLTPEQQVAHLTQYGNSTLAALHAEGFIARRDAGGISFWRNPDTGTIEGNPATAIEVALGDRPVTRMRGKEVVDQTARGLYLRVPAKMRETADGLAAAIGDAAKQRESGWARYLNHRGQASDVTAHKLNVGRPLTQEEVTALTDALPDGMYYSAGETGGIIHVIDSDSILDRSVDIERRYRSGDKAIKAQARRDRAQLSGEAEERARQVDAAVHAAFPGDQSVEIGEMAHRGNLLGDGDYQARISAARRSDLFQRVRDRLTADFEAIDRAFRDDPVAASTRTVGGAEHAHGGLRGRVPALGEGAAFDEFGNPIQHVRFATGPRGGPLRDETLATPHEPLSELTPEQQLKQGLRSARSQYGKQKVSRSEERRLRAQKVAEAQRTISDPDEVDAVVAEAMRGELPKIDFYGLTTLNHDSLRYLKQHVNRLDTLPPFSKVRLNKALDAAVKDHHVPTPSEMKLIEHVFGKQTATGVAQASGGFAEKLMNALNIPRSLQSTLDLSAVARQGLVAGAAHPVLAGRTVPKMLKAARSPAYYEKLMTDIESDPLYPLALAADVSFTDLGEHASVAAHEEAFGSDLPARVPYLGAPVRASSRAYTGYLNKMRMDLFKHQIRSALAAGQDVHDEEFLVDIGRVINASTGRGTVKNRFFDLSNSRTFEQTFLPAANTMLFSPRLMLSRINYLNPFWYLSLHPAARREALRGLFAASGAIMTTLYLFSRIPGVEVGSVDKDHPFGDPRSADFGKLKIGNTRIDVAGGFQQYIRLASVLLTQTKVSSTTGKKTKLGTGKFGSQDTIDVLVDFMRGKASPAVGIAANVAARSNVIGEPTTPTSIAEGSFIPLILQDTHDLYKEHHGGVNGLLWALGGYGLGAFGLGLQTYKGKEPVGGWSGGSSGGSDPFGGGGGGGSDPFGGGGGGGGGGNPFGP